MMYYLAVFWGIYALWGAFSVGLLLGSYPDPRLAFEPPTVAEHVVVGVFFACSGAYMAAMVTLQHLLAFRVLGFIVGYT